MLTVPAEYVKDLDGVLCNGKVKCVDKGGEACDTVDVCVRPETVERMETTEREEVCVYVLSVCELW